jgi:hypothetical protein
VDQPVVVLNEAEAEVAPIEVVVPLEEAQETKIEEEDKLI